MNEASSKFVDNLAIDKLLNEKLKKVNHSPEHSLFVPAEGLFTNKKYSLNFGKVSYSKKSASRTCFEIPSFEKSAYYSENNTIYLHYYPAQNPDYNILFVHGLFDENMLNYEYLIKLLNELKFNVYFMIMPYHFERKPETSLFSGEYFFSGDLFRTQNAFKQAVLDIEACFQFIGNESNLPNILMGFSMGGCVSLRHHVLNKQETPTFLINPLTNLSSVIWDSPLLVTIGRDLKKIGLDMEKCEKFFVEMDPCKNLGENFSGEKIAMVYSNYDQIIEENKYRNFIEIAGIKNAQAYNAGHLNILRVPKLAKDVYDFVKQAY